MKTNIAFLIGIFDDKTTLYGVDDYLDELSRLAETAGFKTAGRLIQDKRRINPRFLLSKGKLEELVQLKKETPFDFLIFDDDISPSQARNLEKYLENVVVMDRCGLILEIFKEHAKTKEAKVQVELAQLNYSYSRLSGKWAHLSRQRGGIGMKEVGEKQLEIDRRLVVKKIHKLTQKLKTVDKEKKVQRKARNHVFTASLVGYTNAGKSTVMNTITGAGVSAEDKLFATLDSTVRVLQKNMTPRILLSDTVGFIDKLPHQLVASFKTTLDEVMFSDLLIKVVDVSAVHFEHQMTVISRTLKELKLEDKTSFWLFNKIDEVDEETLHNLKQRFKGDIFISAKENTGVEALVNRIEEQYKSTLIKKSLLISYENANLITDIHNIGCIEEKEYRDDGVFLTFWIPESYSGINLSLP